MKKILATILFIFLNIFTLTNAYAEWQKVDGITGASELTHYIDPYRIEREAKPYPFLWVMLDKTNPEQFQGKNFYSYVQQIEFNCSAKKSRTGMMYLYSEPMGRGNIVGSWDSSKDAFQTPPPNSPIETYMLITCTNTST